MANEIEYLQSQIAEVERKLRLIEDRKNEYVDHKAIPLDLIDDENKHRNRLEELRRRLEALSEATIYNEGTSRLSSGVKAEKIYVDRDDERRLFRQMTSGQSDIHILLMEATGGMGKTLLLDQFWEISEGFKRARIDFKHTSYSIGEILRDMCDQYGSQSFSMFHDVCIDILRQLDQDVKHIALLWSAMNLKLTGLADDKDRGKYLQMITDAFLANLETVRDTDQPIVMLFDTFEKASNPIKMWIAEQLISAIRHYPRLVCVVTGRETPRIATDDTSWCLQQTLQPLSPKHRKEYIQKVKIIQNEELVTFIIKHSKGNPLILQQLVQTLLEE